MKLLLLVNKTNVSVLDLINLGCTSASSPPQFPSKSLPAEFRKITNLWNVGVGYALDKLQWVPLLSVVPCTDGERMLLYSLCHVWFKWAPKHLYLMPNLSQSWMQLGFRILSVALIELTYFLFSQERTS